MMLNVCDNPTVLEVMRIVKIILTIIRIVVPLILIISLMIGYTKAVANKDADALSKANKTAVAKVIAAILVFFIPTFVNIIGHITGETSYLSCINIASSESISESYKTMAQSYLNRAKTSLSLADYNNALNYVNKIKDESTKESLLNELNTIKQYVDIASEINNLKQNYDANKYNEIKNKINNIADPTIKKKLTDMINSISTGAPLNVQSSFNQYNDTTYPIFKGYYLYIPKNATTNMPLIVMFPPNSLSGPSMKQIAQTKSLDNLQAFIYIPLLASSERKDWNMSASDAAVKKIKDLIKQYQLDENRISLTAFSSSGYYIYLTANNYRIFSAIAPISSSLGIDKIKGYNDWTYLKSLPMKGYGEKGGATTATGKSCANKTVSWSAVTAMCGVFEGLGKCSDCQNCSAFTYMKDSCHGDMGKDVFGIDNNNNNIYEWMISQRK